MSSSTPVGNPYTCVDARPVSPPWKAADLATPEASRTFFERADLPVGSGDGFWFACPEESGSAKEVRLFTDVARPGRTVPMTREPGGAFTLRFPTHEVDRLEYSFQVIDEHGHLHWRLDEANERRVDSPFGPKSEAVGPGYRLPAYVSNEPGHGAASSPAADGDEEAASAESEKGAGECPRGTIREAPIPGRRGRVRTARIWHPVGHGAGDALPILVFLDGGDYLRFAGMQGALASLVRLGWIEPCHAVFVPPNVDRFREYSASPRTSAWLASVLPRALASYVRIPRNPARRIGVGASLGGLALLQAHFGHPGFFGGLVLQSGSFFQRETDEMVSAFAHFGRICRFVRSVGAGRASAPRIPIRMTCGLAEENLVNNRAMKESLVALHMDATLNENRDAHNWIAWRDSVGRELASLLPGPRAAEAIGGEAAGGNTVPPAESSKRAPV